MGIRSILAVALLCATASTGRAEQIGARQTLECRGAYCVPDSIFGDPNVPTTRLAYAPRAVTYGRARAVRAARARRHCYPVNLDGVGRILICSPSRER